MADDGFDFGDHMSDLEDRALERAKKRLDDLGRQTLHCSKTHPAAMYCQDVSDLVFCLEHRRADGLKASEAGKPAKS